MIHFIGAGPGDPELITVRGRKLIDEADVIIYAGSLVNPDVLKGSKPTVEIHNSAYMDLDEVMDVMSRAEKSGLKAVRVHTGDPAIYGAIREQMDRLEEMGIEFDVVPGVSSFLAVAAVLKKEYTLPDVSQTVIVTRMEGRTPVPEKERLIDLARHNASMAIFLSIGFIDEMCKTLVEGGYSPDTPVAVVYKATWPDEKIVLGSLADIAGKVKAEKIDRTALTVVGRFLGGEYGLSKLYDKHFTTMYRKGAEEQ
ncbi:MAG: precorrin-4 C(11)-methyltransferase [Candidatus Methanoplasma sp.]|jgi:precorrin-4/cobalt-precorrin-4 C11-methyltransferase|nr:precorrin-4 C(11)-methyltransferase [Candidatus Methanoplasma sp.]